MLFSKRKDPEYEAAKERVLKLHNESKTLYYVDDVYKDDKGNISLCGICAKGTILKGDTISVYSCNGEYLGDIKANSLYVKNAPTDKLEGGDKKATVTVSVSVPTATSNDIAFICGQLLIKI